MFQIIVIKADEAMDWLTFWSSVIGSVAWPMAAFGVAFLFRRQLRKLIDRIKKLSLGENSVDFGEKLDEAEAEAAMAIPANAPAIIAPPLPNERAQQLIALSPSAAVLDTWRVVERKTLQLAEPFYSGMSTNRDGKRIVPFRAAVKALFDHGVISRSTHSLLHDLQQLRNAAAHNDEVSAAEAVRFMTLATEVLLLLDGPDVTPDAPAD